MNASRLPKSKNKIIWTLTIACLCAVTVLVARILPQNAQAYHPDIMPGCPDVEVNGASLASIASSNEQYLPLVPPQSSASVSSIGEVTGSCTVRGLESPQNPVCVDVDSYLPYITFHGIHKKSIPRDLYRLLAYGTTGGQSSSATGNLTQGTWWLRASTAGNETPCQLLEPSPGYGYGKVHVNVHPPKEEYCPTEDKSGNGKLWGNPCDASNGNKSQLETDYESPINGFSISRAYNSYVPNDYGLGAGWTAPFLKRLDIGVNMIRTRRADGSGEALISSGGQWVAGPDGTRTLTQDASGYELTLNNGDTEDYDLAGRILTENIKGYTLTYTYNASGQLQDVQNDAGHAMSFTYDVDGHIDSITTPGNTVYQYAYDSKGNLTSVTYPDASVRQYHYENASYPNALTGITDENSDRFSTYAFDSYGYATSTEYATTTNGSPQEKFQLSYNLIGTQTTITTPQGHQIVQTYAKKLGVPKLTKSTNQGDGKYLSLTYDAQNNVISRRNEEGVTTTYTYNSDNQKTSMTEASGTPEARTTNYSYYSSDVDLVTSVDRPSVWASGTYDITTTYDANLYPNVVTQSGYEPDGTSVSRVTDFDYNANGQLTQIDGPRTDVSDITTFEYYICTTGAECNQLKKVTDPLGHITTYDSYDGHGRVTQMTDPNGLVTSYTYNNRGNLLTITETPITGPARLTTNTYDDVGQLLTVTSPSGQVLTYGYDEAHDLRSITDNFGNKIEYEYDLAGNRTEDTTKDPSEVVKRTVTTTYDLRNRVDTINAAGSITDLLFDAVGNLTDETDPNLNNTDHSYDPLNRITETIDALTGSTTYDYDINDNLISVDAPNGVTTTYEYDDLGSRLKEVSPDRGTLTYTYDEAGNRLTETDARGKVTSYEHDALNRLTKVTLDDLSTINYEYDVGSYAKGRLNKITDSSGKTEWQYDIFGATTQKKHTIGTVALTVDYGYDSSGRLSTITLPSGKVVTYGHSTYLQTSVTVDSTTILSGATYDPFGPVTGWTWGNSTSHSRSYNQRGLMDSLSMVTDTRTLGYDNAGNLTSLSDNRHTDTFDYDALNRLDDFDHSGSAPLPATQDFTYDANGNRASIKEGPTTYTYTNTANTNRLASTTGPTAKTFTYDAAGNVTDDNIHTYSYDDRGRLTDVNTGSVTYEHNGQGQRVSKDDGSEILFAYDEAGALVGEYDSVGIAIQETVYFQGAPVAIVIGADEYYVHTDHLGTPRIVTDGNSIIWRWESDPFGTTAAQQDPDGDQTDFTYNLRFPGQYYDGETDLHYNYFRDYDAFIGRYVQSDPIGIDGGLNTYGYAMANPLAFSDPSGLQRHRGSTPGYYPLYFPRGGLGHVMSKIFGQQADAATAAKIRRMERQLSRLKERTPACERRFVTVCWFRKSTPGGTFTGDVRFDGGPRSTFGTYERGRPGQGRFPEYGGGFWRCGIVKVIGTDGTQCCTEQDEFYLPNEVFRE